MNESCFQSAAVDFVKQNLEWTFVEFDLVSRNSPTKASATRAKKQLFAVAEVDLVFIIKSAHN